MSIKEQPSPELGIKSLTTAAARPCAFTAYTNNTHFYKSTENVNVFRFYCILTVCFAGPWEYSAFEVHAVEWEEPEVETEDSVGAVFIFKVNFIENRKIMPYQ